MRLIMQVKILHKKFNAVKGIDEIEYSKKAYDRKEDFARI